MDGDVAERSPARVQILENNAPIYSLTGDSRVHLFTVALNKLTEHLQAKICCVIPIEPACKTADLKASSFTVYWVVLEKSH